jgi:hypothetical protein
LYKLVYDEKGNPTPYGFIDMNMDEMKINFVVDFNKSTTRQNIFNGYMQYCTDLYGVIKEEFYQWINGSFTTTKINPRDIDLVNLISLNRIQVLGQALCCFDTNCSNGQVKIDYNVDGYIIPIPDAQYPEYYEYFNRNISYWQNQWGRDRDGNPKGIIRIKYEGKNENPE